MIFLIFIYLFVYSHPHDKRLTECYTFLGERPCYEVKQSVQSHSQGKEIVTQVSFVKVGQTLCFHRLLHL